ncbi:DUF4105 domain-containing protein [Entomomonas sp. E2T0]|uniref:DUF7844 domain-containing protein n=1 Tax=Entomomonas sp. E2T0 TaxID=2930213 RepID=UPI0039B6F5DF
MKLVKYFLTAIGFVVYSSYCLAELDLKLDSKGLTEQEITASQQLLLEAKSLLPPTFAAKLDHRITISWSDLLPNEAYGRTNGRFALYLNKRLLPSLVDGSAAAEKNDRPHGTVRKELLATVIHELAHLYDDAGLFSNDQLPQIRYCQRLAKSQGVKSIPSYCMGFLNRHFTLSDDAEFLDLAGWPLLIGESDLRDDQNTRIDRSPDHYELTNPKEFMAVNMEYFLFDKNYACRRPRLNNWLVQHFNWQPADQAQCSRDYVYLYANDAPGSSPLEHLDPERIYEVDYLFAAANKNWMSRWGHSMLRLVVCAPDRPRGPDCRLDLEYHRVLSYRAFINDLQISSIKGLTGSYPSRLFILPLNQVVDEYTKLEWRPLESVPLKLSRSELLSLVDQAVELHWSYDGNYYFITNNCAVETLKLLRSGTNRIDLQTLDTITPSGLLKLLEVRGLADTSVLKDRKEAMRLGYFFDSYRDRYEMMFQVIKEQLAVPEHSVDEWLMRPALSRQQFFKKADLRTTAALVLLEQASVRRQTLLAYQVLKDRYLKPTNQLDNQQQLTDTQDNIQQLVQHSGFLSRPASLLKDGYGLPLPDEIAKLSEASLAKQQQLDKVMLSLKDQLKMLLPVDLVKELDGTEANIKILSEQLRTLHTASGGLQLDKLNE